MSKLYEIWCEGDPSREYTACHLGYGKGKDFLSACDELASKSQVFNDWFDRTNMEFKRCKLHDNYESASIAYG